MSGPVQVALSPMLCCNTITSRHALLMGLENNNRPALRRVGRWLISIDKFQVRGWLLVVVMPD